MDHRLSFCESGLDAKRDHGRGTGTKAKDILRYFVNGSNACCCELEAAAVTKMHKTKAARIVGMKCCNLQDPNKTMVSAQSRKGCMQCRCCFDRSIVAEQAASNLMAKQIVKTE
jgi:hypothetical protein